MAVPIGRCWGRVADALRVRSCSRADLCHAVRELPARLPAKLDSDGIGRPFSPPGWGLRRLPACSSALPEAALAASCILTLVIVGKGHARALRSAASPGRSRPVSSGPQSHVPGRLALAGAAMFYGSRGLIAYLLPSSSSSPTRSSCGTRNRRFRRTFGNDYDNYTRSVGRWWPRL